MRKVLFSTVALAALVGQAFAADLPSIKEAPVYVAPPPIFSWTGLYVGADIGGSWGSANIFAPGTLFTFSHNAKNDGVTGGGFIGYNYQFNNFVLGLQGEIDGTGNGNSRFSAPFGASVFRVQRQPELDRLDRRPARLGRLGPRPALRHRRRGLGPAVGFDHQRVHRLRRQMFRTPAPATTSAAASNTPSPPTGPAVSNIATTTSARPTPPGSTRPSAAAPFSARPSTTTSSAPAWRTSSASPAPVPVVAKY